MNFLPAILIGYAVGSLPIGYLVAQSARGVDLRQVGSGNVGAANVYRTGGWRMGLAVMLADVAKGAGAVLLVGQAPAAVAAGAAAVVGHIYPVWLGFKGGKGVATNAGVAFGLAWPLGLAYAIVWIGMLAITRISSLAGMSAVVAAAVAAFFLDQPTFAKVMAIIAVLVIWLHRENIKRLMAGTEPRIGGSKAKAEG